MDRRAFLIAAIGMTLGGKRAVSAANGRAIVYLGSFSTWGKPRGRGLEIGLVDRQTGLLTITGTVDGVPDASFLTLSADRRTLYAVSELKPAGRVTALDIGTDPLRPSVLNSQASGGAGPTHLSVHPGGRHLLTAHYTDGTVAVHPLLADGRIGAATDLARHDGGSRSPRAHQIAADPSGRWIVAADVGADAVYVYALDPVQGRLKANQRLQLPAGAGPRHLVFHPNGRYAYILGELRSEITVAAWDAAAGRLTPGQVIGTLGETSPAARNFPAEIQVSPDGHFLYASNRGHDSIVMFSVDPGGGQLRFGGTTPAGGAGPRHFTLDPSGRRLYIANQKSNGVTWLPRDPVTGKLGPAAGSTAVNGVAMLLFG